VPLGAESTVAGQPGARNGNADVLASPASRIDPAEVAQRMVTTFRSEIPGYARMPTSVLSGQILGIAQTNVELFLRLVREGR
jgi:hypothetical protein